MGNALRWNRDQLAAHLQKTGQANPLPAKPAPAPARRKPLTDRDKMVFLFLQQIALLGIPEPAREYRFHHKRKWRFDLAWPSLKIAVEYEGGVYTGGAHTRGKHYESDCEKYNEAAILGWSVLRFTVNLVRSGTAADQVARKLEQRAAEL